MTKSIFNNKLPSNWEWVTLDELLIEKPCNGLYKSANSIGKGTLFLDINGLYKGLTADFSQARRVEVTENEGRQYELVKGDILFNRVSKMPEGVGKAVAVGELQEAAVYESNMIRVRLNKQRVDSLFVVNYLSTNRSRQELLSKANISNQASINQQAIKSLAIPLPPITEQRRILTILDRAEELRSKRREAIAELDTLTQAIFIEMFGDPVRNPKGWEICSIGSFLSDVTNGLTRRRKESDKGTDIVLRLRDIRAGWIDFSDVNRISLVSKELQRYQVESGDLLFIRVNGNPDYVGRCAIFDGFTEPVYFNDHIMRVKTDQSKINGQFCVFVLNGERGKREIASHRKTSAGQHTINQEGLSKINIPLPPLRLQQEFADRVEAVEKLKTAHRASLSELDALFASLQNRAFRGEL